MLSLKQSVRIQMPPKGQCFLHSCFLCTLKTVRSQHENTPITKSADNTGLTGLITDDDNSHCRQQNSNFVNYVMRTTSS